MKADLVIAFRSRWVQTTLSFSLILRIMFLFYYDSEKASDLGPDEGTYGSLAAYVAQGLSVEEFPGWDARFYNSTKTLILPSSVFVRLGLRELDAVRVVSSLYGLLTSLFFILCLLVILRGRQPSINLKDYGNAFGFSIVFFTFFPSNFLWSTLGLRESASQFWIIATFYFLLKIHFVLGKKSFIYLIFASLSLMFAFGARKETALVFGFCALVMGAYLVMITQKLLLVVAAALGIIGGQAFIATPQVTTTNIFYLAPANESNPQSSGSAIKAPLGVCNSEQQKVKIGQVEYLCLRQLENSKKRLDPIGGIKEQLITVKYLEDISRIRSIDAQSALPQSTCKSSHSQIQTKMICYVTDLPYRLSSFLFRPIPIVDSGSRINNVAGLENIIWILLFLIVSYCVFSIQMLKFERFIIAILALYFFTFSVLASFATGNLGTGFRHKSTLLWPLVMMLAIQLSQKKKALNFNRNQSNDSN